MQYILAHDIGTTGNKATLYNSEGTLVASTFASYNTFYPFSGWAEQNPRDWWHSFCLSTRQLLEKAQIAAQEIACVVFSGQMMGVVPVDKQGHALRNAIIWADQRSVAQIKRIEERIDPRRVYALTGHRLSPSYSGGKILWLEEYEPDIYKQTYKFLQAKDFLVARLTGTFVTDPSDASGTNLFNLEQGCWDDELVATFAIAQEKLPPIARSIDVVGEVLPTLAEESGLIAGIPVVLGGGDGSCAATGAGVVRTGVAYNYIGSSSWIGISTEKPILDPEMRTFTWAHLIPGMFTPTGTMQAAGSSYQWARDELAQQERYEAQQQGRSIYELMDQQVLQSPPGARGLLFLPYLLGERSPRWNPFARGAFVGLSINHKHADMLRAVLEGITFNLRVILDAFTQQGATIEALRVIGGGARSNVWNSIMADIFALPIHRLNLLEEATSMGAAVAGGIGVGVWKDFSMVDTMTQVVSEVLPQTENQQRYRELYTLFNEIYDTLNRANLFERLSVLNEV